MVRRLSLAFLASILILSMETTHAQEVSQDGAPEFVPQMGPDKACAQVAFSRNGRFLVTSSLNGAISGTTLQLWEASTARLIRNLRLEPRLPWSYGLYQYGVVAFSPGGQYVAFF